MPSRHRFLACAVALLLAVSAFATAGARQDPATRAQTPPGPPPAATGLIVGHVIDAGSGKAVTGVSVTLGAFVQSGSVFDQNLQPRRVIVDGTGGFVFSNLRPGEYGLDASKFGYLGGSLGRTRPSGGFTTIKVAEGERVGDLKIRIWRQAVLAGTVLDEANDPVVGVTVRVFERVFATGHRRLVARATSTTDDRGMFRIGNLAPGDFVVGVTSTETSLPTSVAEAYFKNPDIGPRPPDANPDLRSMVSRLAPLTPRGDRDTVTMGDVTVQGTARSIAKPMEVASGRLAIYPAVFFPEVAAVGDAAVITLSSGDVHAGVDVHVKAVRTVRITGRLTGPNDLAGLTVLRLIPQAAEASSGDAAFDTATTITDADGAFTLPTVPPGSYVLRAQKAPPSPSRSPSLPTAPPPPPDQPMVWLAEPIAVADKDLDLALSLTPGVRVSGRFDFEGQKPRPTPDKMPQAFVSIDPADGSGASWPLARADASGAFATIGVPPGRYIVRASGPPAGWTLKSIALQGRDVTDVPFEIKSDTSDIVVTLVDQPAEIAGTVSSSDVPLRDATVVVFPTDPAAWADFGSNPPRLKTARPSATDAFRIQNLPPGDYFIAAISDEAFGGWESAFLRRLSGVATRVHLDVGQKLAQNLKVGSIK